jgi:hypothetical protein
MMTNNARKVYRRAEMRDARPLKRATETDLTGFPVRANKCHENVAEWVAAKAGHRHISGWLVIQNDDGYFFRKHSVVGVDGELLDITPRSDEFVHRFLAHEGTPEEFERLPENEIAPHGL